MLLAMLAQAQDQVPDALDSLLRSWTCQDCGVLKVTTPEAMSKCQSWLPITSRANALNPLEVADF